MTLPGQKLKKNMRKNAAPTFYRKIAYVLPPNNSSARLKKAQKDIACKWLAVNWLIVGAVEKKIKNTKI